MKFLNLNIKNFLSIGEAKVNLNDRGLILIEGKNLDDPSAKSNGAGKSSIVDALCFVLYGKTARGLAGDDVVNRKAKKDCRVSVVVQDGEERYLIERYRKCKSSSGVTVQKQIKPEWEPEDLTKGTAVETQALIEQLIGCPYNVFVAAVYAGQDAMPDLPAMTDKQLKELIESVIGVERLTTIYQNVLAKLLVETKSVDAQKMMVSHCEEGLENAKTTLERVIASEKEAAEDRKNTIEAYTNRLAFEEAKYQKRVKDWSISEGAAGIAKASNLELDELIKKDAENKDKLNKLNSNWTRQKATKEMYEHSLEGERKNAVQAINEAKNIDALVGTKCAECGKEYTKDDLAEAKKAKVEQAKVYAAKVQDWQNKIKEQDLVIQKAFEEMKSFEDSLVSNEEIFKKKEENSKVLFEHQRLTDELKMLKKSLQTYEDELKRAKEMSGTSKSMVPEFQDQVELAKTKLLSSKAVLKQFELKRNSYDICKDIFGPQGVRQHILDTITPVLNDRTARYLDALSDGKLQAIWTTLTQTKKGELKEKFNIEVKNLVGGGSFDSLSGGEKRKVRVACCLALQELVASRATKPIELFIADEVDHALDDAGVERLIGVLNEKADVCRSLFVISHNPLRNWIDNTITVVKKDGMSTLEE